LGRRRGHTAGRKTKEFEQQILSLGQLNRKKDITEFSYGDVFGMAEKYLNDWIMRTLKQKMTWDENQAKKFGF